MRKHTFVICAYKESEYLEECIKSIKNQSIKSKVIINTSTDNLFIRELAEKYAIKLYIADHKSNIACDWNYAYRKVNTPYVTIAHQDDIYDREYAEKAVELLERADNPLIFFCDYYEIKNGKKISRTKNLMIKKIMLLPLKIKFLRKTVLIKRLILSMGNPICCPAVTYVKDNLPEKVFRVGYKSNIDWEAWERLSRMSGEFVYTGKKLMGHRVHEGSTTTEIIGMNLRTIEDLEMLKKFWPEKIAKIINKVYKNAEKSNG